MPPGYYLFVFCLVTISVVNARRSEEQSNVDWQISNTMSREDGEEYAPINKYPDTINIDDNKGYSSGDGMRDDEWGSGFNGDDERYDEEDDFSGGGDRNSEFPPMNPNKRPGAGTGNDGYDIPKSERPVDNDGIIYDNERPDHTETDKPVVIKPAPEGEDDDDMPTDDHDDNKDHSSENLSRSIIQTPGLLPGIIGGAVVGLLCAVLLVMFIVYRMRKKDEGSYALEEPKMGTSPSRGYTRAPTKEYWA